MDNEKLNEYIKNNERINFRLAENEKILRSAGYAPPCFNFTVEKVSGSIFLRVIFGHQKSFVINITCMI